MPVPPEPLPHAAFPVHEDGPSTEEFEAELRVIVSRGCQEQVPAQLRARIARLIDHERGVL